MTWSASHIYAEPKPSVISAFCFVDALSDGLYLVKDFAGHEWWHDENRHNIPVNGLLIVRELSSSADQSDEADVVFWDDVACPSNTNIINLPGVPPYGFPPAAFLRFLKWVSDTTDTTITYYHCEMWGGLVDNEFAWIFDREDKVYVLNTLGYAQDNNPDVKIPDLQYLKSVIEYTETGQKIIPDESLLALTLRPYGINLSHTGYFALHTRSFDWKRYKLPCRNA